MSAKEFVLLGHPVGHSMSPAIHGAVYQRYGLEHRYLTVDCPDESALARQIERLRTGEIAGANVTVPWKREALRLADRADATAAATGAANVLRLDDDGRVVAYNTDVEALAERIRRGAVPGAERAVVLGNGGAAQAAVVACRTVGIESIDVTGRSWRVGDDPAGFRHRAEFDRLRARPVAWSDAEQSELRVALLGASVIVQATSAGMLGKGGGEGVAELLPWKRLRSDVFLYDVVYNPPVTPFLERARSLGLSAEGGLSMLVGQAALAVTLWLDVAAPRAEMAAAAERHLLEGTR
jgi:shikimate dehydrogenase